MAGYANDDHRAQDKDVVRALGEGRASGGLIAEMASGFMMMIIPRI